MALYAVIIQPYFKYIKGFDNDTAKALNMILLTNYDVTNSDIKRETLYEIYCFDKIYGNKFPLKY